MVNTIESLSRKKTRKTIRNNWMRNFQMIESRCVTSETKWKTSIRFKRREKLKLLIHTLLIAYGRKRFDRILKSIVKINDVPNTIDTKYVLHILRKMKKKKIRHKLIYNYRCHPPKKKKTLKWRDKNKEDEDDYIFRRCFKLSKEVRKIDKLIRSITTNNSICKGFETKR